ncbi:metallopeptidase family protein [Hansschlegelia sp.]|uniref:metallopeptidase family protein n=1 Tax=Hansschlegelia sp. TaxID=2041892 RepID=UPI002BA34515|nr:metallopeptidase family protein [Hansschlegelia sp.]HVI27246.1 metallopeptidase family protein [Hansschlegelia sp.]
MEWTDRLAPDLADLERLAEESFARLPEAFRALAAQPVIRVDDFPTDEVLAELGAESEFDLLGLFTGVGMAHADAVPRTGQMPNVIHLYRRPILDYWAEHEEKLGAIVTHVLVHEIGHHFGLSDDDIEAIEAAAAAEA